MRGLSLAVGGLAFLVTFLFIVAVACGDNEAKETPTPGAPEVQDQLRRMVLQADDLAPGFNLIDEAFSTNEAVAAGSEDPEGKLAKLRQWGRLLGYGVAYEPAGGIGGETIVFSVNSTASAYEDADGAAASFADAAQTAKDTDWVAYFQGVEDIVVEEVLAPPVADETLWLRIKGRAAVGEQTFAQDLLLLRQGASRGSLQVASFGTEESKQLIEGLIRAQAQRMAAGR